jgi:tetratricopeptide (TPR) repeat protein
MSSANTRSIGPLDPSGLAPLPLHPGDLVADRYEVLRFLGSGGSAFVYAVRDRKIGDEIALKLLRDGRRSDIDVERTRREAEFARGSSSPRLVRSFDLVESDGLLFLTMELVAGGSLRDLLRGGPLPVDEAVRLACEILEALADLHRLDIVHRDLKPGNLLLTPDGHVKLSDFGIARRWTDEESRLTSTGLPVGTVDYLSPEQAAAEAVDPRSDLYSLGVVLFEMLTGRVPFEAPSAVGSIVMRLQRRAEDVRKLRPETPRWLAAVVARLLATKREDRYGSAEEVLEDLRWKRTRVPWRSVRIAIALLVILLVLGVVVWRGWTSAPRLVTNGELGIRAIDTEGNTLWTRQDTTPYRAAVVHRGNVYEVAAMLNAADATTPRLLSFLDARTGHVLRTRTLPTAERQFSGHSPRFGVHLQATDLDRDGYDEVIVMYAHDYWPSFLVLHNLRRDESWIIFIASGHHRVAATEDLDGDGVAELILEGIANRQGWYRALAAIRVRLDRPPENYIASTPDRFEYVRSDSLLWYALCPPGSIKKVIVDPNRKVIRAEYESHLPVEVNYTGFDATSKSMLPAGERQATRELAYAQLRDAVRLANGGIAEAVGRADAARVLAERAGDAMLIEWCTRVRGIALVRTRRFDEAEAFFTQIARTGNASEIAWDAAHVFHLEGELPRAIAWYRRNLGAEGEPGVGRMKYESIEGEVLALGEIGRWAEALSAIDRFEATFSNESAQGMWYRRYVEWRTGGVSATGGLDYGPNDVYRYWSFEIELARGVEPHELLHAIDADRERASETRSLLPVARAEALWRAGHIDEALNTARSALSQLRTERRTSVFARAHFDLAAERLAALAEMKGLVAEAKEVRDEAAALRWHPNGIHH